MLRPSTRLAQPGFLRELYWNTWLNYPTEELVLVPPSGRSQLASIVASTTYNHFVDGIIIGGRLTGPYNNHLL